MDSVEADDEVVCASCGKAECKQRAAKIRDDKLFTQPDGSHHGECPICCLALSLDVSKWSKNSCCCKLICIGCSHANKLREIEQGLEQKCPYCREGLPETDEEIKQNFVERAKVNDPAALFQMGVDCYHEGDFEGAVQYWKKAAVLGEIDAHHNLSLMYHKGEGVEKDEKKELYHREEAAIGGHHVARFNLGVYEEDNRRIERAMKHYIIAASLGYDKALDEVKEGFAYGLVSKEDFEAALRGHQAAVDATKSEQREEACAFFKRNGL